MSMSAELLLRSLPNGSAASIAPGSDRRMDIDAKQAQVGALLRDVECEGLLLLEPENFAWLTSGAAVRGVLNPAEWPVLYFSPEYRWVIASNTDSQRLFDEELDGLGFQLKEWPWHWGREQLLNELFLSKRLACDRPFGGAKVVAAALQQLRRALTPYEQACLLALGEIIGHALEACCRTLVPGQSEREVAGQASHRLVHRGVQAV